MSTELNKISTKGYLESIQKKYSDRSPIYIFAGGTSHNYKDFSHMDGSFTPEQTAKFVTVKGPDFVSRLRGHIDILGPNRVDDYDDGYVIRRAILLRSILLERLNTQEQDKDLEYIVDPCIIRSLLRVSSYNHGSRSMRAIINMSNMIGGPEGRLVASTLPTLAQLNMHVDGKEFLEMVIDESQKIKSNDP